MKILIGVLSNDHVWIPHRDFGYKAMVDASRETCFSEKVEGVDVYFMYNQREGVDFGNNVYGVHEDCFYYNWPEHRKYIINKTMAFFHYAYNNLQFDYIFRTNCGSYVDQQLLKKHVESIGIKENIYMSIENHIERYKDQPVDIKYGSGAGILLSRDVVGKLLAYEPELRDGIDDVEFGRVLQEKYSMGVTPGAIRKDVKYEDLISDASLVDNECYHYYFRATRDPRCYHEAHRQTLKNREGARNDDE